MKMLIILSVTSLLLSACSLRTPSATMTETYIEAANIGQYLRLMELDAVKIDSSFDYPTEENPVVSYILAFRKTTNDAEGDIAVKIFLSKRNSHFVWKTYRDLRSANFIYQDTIHIKPYTWYKLTAEKSGFHSYFYWNGKKG